jgi:hypothetical protein
MQSFRLIPALLKFPVAERRLTEIREAVVAEAVV